MKNLHIQYASVILFSAWTISANAEGNLISGGFSGAVGGGISGASTTASVFKVEYEHKFSDLMTLTAGIGSLSYNSTNSDYGWTYEEDGEGTSIFAEVNFYPKRDALNGFYLGPGIGLTPLTTSWTENDSGTIYRGDESASMIDIHGKVGFKINAGSVIIDPNVRIGYFLNSPTGGTNNDSNLGIYVLIGANVGMPF